MGPECGGSSPPWAQECGGGRGHVQTSRPHKLDFDVLKQLFFPDDPLALTTAPPRPGGGTRTAWKKAHTEFVMVRSHRGLGGTWMPSRQWGHDPQLRKSDGLPPPRLRRKSLG